MNYNKLIADRINWSMFCIGTADCTSSHLQVMGTPTPTPRFLRMQCELIAGQWMKLDCFTCGSPTSFTYQFHPIKRSCLRSHYVSVSQLFLRLRLLPLCRMRWHRPARGVSGKAWFEPQQPQRMAPKEMGILVICGPPGWHGENLPGLSYGQPGTG